MRFTQWNLNDFVALLSFLMVVAELLYNILVGCPSAPHRTNEVFIHLMVCLACNTDKLLEQCEAGRQGQTFCFDYEHDILFARPSFSGTEILKNRKLILYCEVD